MPGTVMMHELASAHEERKRLDARIRELEEALRPFAKHAPEPGYDPDLAYSAPLYARDYLRAAAAMENK